MWELFLPHPVYKFATNILRFNFSDNYFMRKYCVWKTDRYSSDQNFHPLHNIRQFFYFHKTYISHSEMKQVYNIKFSSLNIHGISIQEPG